MNQPFEEVFVTNTNNTNIKISMHRISGVFWEDLKATNWMVEFRYFMTVAVAPSILIIMGLFIFNYDEPLFIGFILGWLLWLIYTSCGTTHESRKKNISDIFWCIDPYMYPSLPSLTRQSLLIKHSLNIKEFVVFSAIQRLHLILGVLLMFAVFDIILMLQRPHLNENQFLGLYSVGIISSLAFFTGGVHEDMKLHYIKVVPEVKKNLWKYTFFVFLYSLVGITVMYLSVAFIIRQVLQPS